MKRLLILCIFVSGCVSSCTPQVEVTKLEITDTNPLAIQNYLPGLFSSAEMLRVNNFVKLDDNESFSYIVDNNGFVSGDREKLSTTLNWGKASEFVPYQCEFENFWTYSTKKFMRSTHVKGMLVNFGTIEITLENFQQSKVLVLGQYTLVLDSQEKVDQMFSIISENLDKCSEGVRAINFSGSILELGIKESPYKNRQFFMSQNMVVRSAQDELVSLDVYIKSKYSITFYKIFLNDLTMPNQSTWPEINSLIDAPLVRICVIESVTCPSADLSKIVEFKPKGTSSTKVDF